MRLDKVALENNSNIRLTLFLFIKRLLLILYDKYYEINPTNFIFFNH